MQHSDQDTINLSYFGVQIDRNLNGSILQNVVIFITKIMVYTFLLIWCFFMKMVQVSFTVHNVIACNSTILSHNFGLTLFGIKKKIEEKMERISNVFYLVFPFERATPRLEDLSLDDQKKVALKLSDKKDIKKLQKLEVRKQKALMEVSQFNGELSDKDKVDLEVAEKLSLIHI